MSDLYIVYLPRTARRLGTETIGLSLRQRRAWYADEPPATPAPQTPAPDANKPSSSGVSDSDGEEIPDWVMKDPKAAYAALQKVRREAETHRLSSRELQKKVDEFQAAKKKQEEDELAEQNLWQEAAEKAKKERDEALDQLKQEKLNSLRTRVGTEFKLPAKLTARLQGTTEDEIRADAEALAKDLGLDKAAETPAPTQPPPKTPPTGGRQQTTAVAPGGQPAGETDEQRRARLYKRGAINSPVFRKPDE